jgi:hypothetical protein
MTKIDYEIQFIKDELIHSTFPELGKDYLQTWLIALEWAKDNWGVYVD